MARIGRPPTKYILTPMQKLTFLDTLADFKAECEAVNPERKGNCSKVTEVKKRFAKKLMEHEEFSDENLDTSEHSRAQWEGALVKRYANYDLRKIQNGNNSKKSASKKKNEPLKAVTPFILFDDDISSREHFISKLDPAELREKYQKVRETKGIPVCAARNQVVSELWNAADQEKEAAELEVMKTKVDCNQKYFSGRAMQSLEKMLSSGRLGSGALSLAWAFRDPNTNTVQAGRLNIGFDATSEEVMDHGYEGDVEGWVDHANAILPKYTIQVATTIPRGADGQPLFPSFNQDDISLAVMKHILRDYFVVLWDYTLSDSEESAAIPWDAIAERPGMYYSSRKYPYVNLRRPEDMSRAQVVALAEKLDRDRVENPFKFYSWKKIKRRLKKSKTGKDSALPSSYSPAEVSKAVRNTPKDSNGTDDDKERGHSNHNDDVNANGEEDDGYKEDDNEADGYEDGNNTGNNNNDADGNEANGNEDDVNGKGKRVKATTGHDTDADADNDDADRNEANGNEDDDHGKGKHVKAATGSRTTKATTKSAAPDASRNQSANSDDVSGPRRSGRERHPPKRVLEGGELDFDVKKTKKSRTA
ncbi:hypothetical protein D9613_012973 [Agrocybe pediades]|uniref:Uncharacterized protein n=1 Tax=Agrocybe pediades TaxID=84607 RepID=A0A8H4QLE2_9AGAR|nr:hypothetical protein D9613_012973 [Agrocybe pediades]